jgi:hypothetical protein
MHYLSDVSQAKDIIENSKYKDIYLGYSSIDYDKLDIRDHISMCDGGFIMPYCFKETEIPKANKQLLELVDALKKKGFYFLPFVDNNVDERLEIKEIIGLKEHFLVHDSFRYYERIESYKYLNEKKKMLLLHCDNSIRIEYVRHLTQEFPDMIIQVAHLGVFRNSYKASKLVIDELSVLENVYFDISTVFDAEIIKYAVSKMPNRVLFGTDVPYIQDKLYFEKYNNVVKMTGLSDEVVEKLYYKNATSLIERIM